MFFHIQWRLILVLKKTLAANALTVNVLYAVVRSMSFAMRVTEINSVAPVMVQENIHAGHAIQPGCAELVTEPVNILVTHAIQPVTVNHVKVPENILVTHVIQAVTVNHVEVPENILVILAMNQVTVRTVMARERKIAMIAMAMDGYGMSVALVMEPVVILSGMVMMLNVVYATVAEITIKRIVGLAMVKVQ